MSKLTLSVDPKVVSKAKHYAKQRGMSISQMVETYLAAVSDPAVAPGDDLPVLRSVRGVLKRADLREYKRHLVKKYR